MQIKQSMMTDTVEISEIRIEMMDDSVHIKENIKSLFKDFCEERIRYLLLENDKEQNILRQIRSNDFQDKIEKSLWVDNDLNNYLFLERYNYQDISIVCENIFIETCSYREWNTSKYDELKSELTQIKYINVLYALADEYFLSIWKWTDITQNDINNLFDAILMEYNRILICDKTVEELLEYVNELCPEFSPK